MGSVITRIPLPLAGAAELRTDPAHDARGWFARFFCQRTLLPENEGRSIQQINCSHTVHRGTVRGMHLQHPPHAEDKVVRCIRGKVYDVMVDLRRSSATFGRWHAVVLDAGELNMVYIPRGFAHGFQTLEDHCEILYLHTEFHVPEAEGGIRYNSPALGIPWPLSISNMSARDRELPIFDAAMGGLPL